MVLRTAADGLSAKHSCTTRAVARLKQRVMTPGTHSGVCLGAASRYFSAGAGSKERIMWAFGQVGARC